MKHGREAGLNNPHKERELSTAEQKDPAVLLLESNNISQQFVLVKVADWICTWKVRLSGTSATSANQINGPYTPRDYTLRATPILLFRHIDHRNS